MHDAPLAEESRGEVSQSRVMDWRTLDFATRKTGQSVGTNGQTSRRGEDPYECGEKLST